jgi:hypothetical protein
LGAGVVTLVVAGLGLAGSPGCGRAGGSSDGPPLERTAGSTSPADAAALVERPPNGAGRRAAGPLTHLESLRKRGRFEEFIDAALNAADERGDARLDLLKTEALLAHGNGAAAESAAERAASAAMEAGDAPLAVQSLKLWVLARFRQGKSLASDVVEELAARLPSDDSGAQLIRFWFAQLAERTPYAPGGADAAIPVEIPATRAAAGTIWADLNAIEARANGVSLPMVFIDTGAQPTIITRRAAENAGLVLGPSATQLVGFAGVAARPAVLETLDLGGLTLDDVPVLVADSPPLLSANGQMALGTELMHHVRFTLDYPARRVVAERADQPPTFDGGAPQWVIPLWTFPQACLARAEGAHGAAARVLVDTGNRTGTYVSAAWARRHLSQFERPTSTLIFKFRHQGLKLDTMDLGNVTLRDWPILDRMPGELEKLDLVDVLMGRDLLWPYRLTIDLRERVLRLRGGPQKAAPPVEATP